jgi:integrase/recombinase XerD
MYEHFRNDFQCAAADHGVPQETIASMLGLLDNLASRYEVSRKETSLALFHEELPETVKTYIVSKKIEGLSQATLDTYLRMLKLFFRDIGKSPAQITTNDIRVYLYRYQQERGCSNRSLDKYRQYLASFFGWAADEGYVQSNPMRTIPAIKYEKKQRQNLTQLELEYLRQCCETPRERAIIEFLFSTGCRVSEIAGVKKTDVDWNARTVHLFGKGSKHRTSYLNAKAEVSLKAYLKDRTDDSEFLFVTERKPHRGLTTCALEKIVRKIAQRSSAEMNKHVTPHILRHTTATLALQNGMPIADISKLLGHEKIETTMIYAHTCMESVQAGHRKYVV